MPALAAFPEGVWWSVFCLVLDGGRGPGLPASCPKEMGMARDSWGGSSGVGFSTWLGDNDSFLFSESHLKSEFTKVSQEW